MTEEQSFSRRPAPLRADEYSTRNIARETARECIKEFCERLGIDDIPQTRRHLDHLARLVEAQASKRNEGLKALFAVITGAVLGLGGWILGWLSLHH